MSYSKQIDKKWQEKWQNEGLYKFDKNSNKPKFYCMEMFSYPSGANLHLGHWFNFGPADSFARFKSMQGYNVFHPMGFDAFGLPAENYAIKTGIHPNDSTIKNIETMKKQLKEMGATYDWDYSVETCMPDYYKWTQWLFQELYKSGLAYKKKAPVNWCTSCNTVLANEQVLDGECERCKTVIEKRKLEQWFFKITDYAQELLDDLDKIDWPESTKKVQQNWIGRSEGAEVNFKVSNSNLDFTVFTTRPDTLFGVTYIVMAPESELVNKITTPKYKASVEEYKNEAAKISEIDRMSLDREKTGVFTGAYAINPMNNEEIPIWIADYVLEDYGTGYVMAVPAHDERDFEFAKKHNLPIKQVIVPVIKSEDDNKPREDKPYKYRKSVMLVIKHPEEEKYLYIKYKNFDWNCLVQGGIEENETSEVAAIRELKEETGYCDIKKVTKLPFDMDNVYYAAHKEVNRYAYVDTYYIELSSDKNNGISEKENDEHSMAWGTKEELIKAFGDAFKHHGWVLNQATGEEVAYCGDGRLCNSDFLNDLSVSEAQERIKNYLEENNIGKRKINYKLKDWLVSRQRYWGSPIPVIYCNDCGTVLVPEEDLPVILPYDVEFTPDGESPLRKSKEFMECKCPKCGKEAKREADTLDTFVCSSWYFLRYPEAQNTEKAWDVDYINKMLPVDVYVGGKEHAAMHLIYSRFITKALRDMKHINFDEPFTKLVHQGMILGPDGNKMSKSKGNTVAPDEYVDEYGADVFRMYLMFGFSYIDGGPWKTEGIKAMSKYFSRIENLIERFQNTKYTETSETGEKEQRLLYVKSRTIKEAEKDIDNFGFNTAIARSMEFVNEMVEYEQNEKVNKKIFQECIETLIIILSPLAPHFAEELWEDIGKTTSVHKESWPKYNKADLVLKEIEIPVQINGKVKAVVKVNADATEAEIKKTVKENSIIANVLEGQKIIKEIYIPNRIYNIVL